jgi:hypothetical protein
MWLPLVGVPSLIKEGLEPYRDLFCRDAGFEHVSRYVTGLLLRPNKTLQGIYAQQVWPERPLESADERCTQRCLKPAGTVKSGCPAIER